MGSICAYDISHYERPTSFHDAYSAGFILAICKASQGLSYDWAFDGFVRRLKTIPGQLIGAYHYLVGDVNGKAQADHFLEVVGDVPLLACDYEPTAPSMGGTPSLQTAEEFVERIKAVRGRHPLLYGGSLLKDNPVPKGSPLLDCPLWLSQYGPTPVLPPGWKLWRFWQFTGDGEGPEPHDVPGVGKNVDINRFPGTADDLRRWYALLT